MSSPIASLPPELLSSILSHLVPLPTLPSTPYTPLPSSQHLSSLLPLSLISRSFRAAAQPLLSLPLEFNDPVTLHKWLETERDRESLASGEDGEGGEPEGEDHEGSDLVDPMLKSISGWTQSKVALLRLWGSRKERIVVRGEAGEGGLEEILGRVRGLRVLELCNFDGVDGLTAHLEKEGWQGLETLSLHNLRLTPRDPAPTGNSISVARAPPHSPTRSPHLRTLILSSSHLPLPFFTQHFPPPSLSHLTSLTLLSNVSHLTLSSLRSLFPDLAPSLTSLVLTESWLTSPTSPGLTDLLHLCNENLETVKFTSYVPPAMVLAALEGISSTAPTDLSAMEQEEGVAKAGRRTTARRLKLITVEWYPKPEHSRRENMVRDLREVVRRDWGVEGCEMRADERVWRLLEMEDRRRVVFF